MYEILTGYRRPTNLLLQSNTFNLLLRGVRNGEVSSRQEFTVAIFKHVLSKYSGI